MGLLNLFKLEKLTIEAYGNSRRMGLPKATFEAMYNPTSLKQSYAIKWDKNTGLNLPSGPKGYKISDPSTLDFDLILDGTGVEQMGVVNLFSSKTVQDRIDAFKKATYDYQGEIHQPYWLMVKWGSYNFKCVLASVDITYTSFNRDGTPLRAELNVALVSDEDIDSVLKKANPQSSDLTHSRMVRAGDTLPLLTRDIYGTSAYYVDVARFNGMDDFRSVTPGQQVLFPPLEILISGR